MDNIAVQKKKQKGERKQVEPLRAAATLRSSRQATLGKKLQRWKGIAAQATVELAGS